MNKKTIIVAALALAVGVTGGWWLGRGGEEAAEPTAAADSESGGRKILYYRNPMNPAITSPVPAKDEMGMDYIPVYADEEPPKKERKILYYRNPMNPAITSPVPAKDEMGMDYIPVYADEEEGGDEPVGTVKIDPVIVQNIGVRVAKAERRTLAHVITALGKVDLDERNLARLHPKTSGWIERLRIDETGTDVEKDTILLSLYSPELVAAEREYLVALANWEALPKNASREARRTARALLDSARERLELLDVPAHQIRELERTRKIMRTLHIHSPFAGTVMHIGAREGQYVTPKDELYLIADLARVWVYVDVYEDELPWVKVGDPAQMRVRAVPGRVFEGKVTFIYPMMNERTRTNRVRLEFENPDRLLKPGLFADVRLHADAREGVLAIPTEAVVRSGAREQVFVMREPGKFEPREVRLGVEADGWVEVLEGLSEGEQVVTSAQFLIDSESKLKEATAKMLEAMKAEQAGAHDMSDHDMDMGDMDMSDMDMSDLDMSDMDMSDMDMSDVEAHDGHEATP